MKNIIETHNKIIFDSDKHKYTYNGVELISATECLSLFKEPFNKEEILNKLYGHDLQTKAEKRYEWDNSSSWGSYIHELLEHQIMEREDIRTQEIQFINGMKLYNKFVKAGYELVGCEVRVTNGEIAGTIDILMINPKNNKYLLLDFKTCDKISKSGYNGKKFYEPLNNLDDCKFNSYSLQLSLYSTMLEEYYGVEVEGMYLLRISKNGSSEIMKCSNFKEQIKQII